jgi:hypothetical protein
MGMFDIVMVPCPTCEERAEFQSKSGDCTLETYLLEEAPDDVLDDVNRHAPKTCDKCGALFGVQIEGLRPRRVLITRSVLWEGAGDETASVSESTLDVRRTLWEGVNETAATGAAKHAIKSPPQPQHVTSALQETQVIGRLLGLFQDDVDIEVVDHFRDSTDCVEVVAVASTTVVYKRGGKTFHLVVHDMTEHQ